MQMFLQVFFIFFSECSLEQDLFDFKDCYDFYFCLYHVFAEQTNNDLNPKGTQRTQRRHQGHGGMMEDERRNKVIGLAINVHSALEPGLFKAFIYSGIPKVQR